MVKQIEDFEIGDKIVHKYRGEGVVSPMQEYCTDPSSLMIDLDEDGETYEVSIRLVSKR